MFVFPKPAHEPNTSSADAADDAELLLSLSVFGFSQLSASHQHEKTKEIYKKVVEDVVVEQLSDESKGDFRPRTFTELFKKLPFPDQNHFLSTVIKKFKRQRQIRKNMARNQNIHSRHPVLMKGQSSHGQWQLIDQLCDGVKGVMVEKLADESDADFKLRRFTELCNKVVDFGVQVHFLDKAEEHLLHKRRDLPHGVLVQPQDSASAAELLSQLLSFGFSVLSPNDQQDKIEHISNELAAEGVNNNIVERLAGETEEDLRRKTFAKLFNKAPTATRVHLFEGFTEKFFVERRLCDSILLFRQLDSKEQQEKIENMLDQFMRWEGEDVKDVILERLPEECDENFKLRRFIKLGSTYTFLLDHFIWDEAEKWDLKGLRMQMSGKEEIEEIKQSRYAEFYLGLSIIWFKAVCASDPRNIIQVFFGKVGGGGDHTIEKLVNETEEDFRLRRFTESFKQLQFSSQEDIVKCIQTTLLHDLGVGVKFIVMGTPNLRGSGGVTAAQGGGRGQASSR